MKFSKHAIERIDSRGIQRKLVMKVIQTPDTVIDESKCIRIYQKTEIQNGNKYLIRVFVNICKEPELIITAYKTSKIDKYEH